MEFNPTYSVSKLYQSFDLIDRTAHHTIIRFFEDKVEEIKALEYEEYFKILVTYVQALFEIGAYQKHCTMADVVIEASIINNVNVFQGINLFEKTLFQKAASLYNLQHYSESIHILTELIKINPTEPNYKAFWIRNQIQRKPPLLRSFQGISITLFFLTIIMIAIQTFYVEPFRPDYINLMTLGRNYLFLFATITLVGSDGFYRLKAIYQVNQLIGRSKEKLKRS
ncbi:MAG: hypothetical protein ABI844_18275 [Saprospiraceae bacterium]